MVWTYSTCTGSSKKNYEKMVPLNYNDKGEINVHDTSFSSIYVFCKHFHLHRCNNLIWLKSINVAITLIRCRSRSEKIRIVWLTPRSFIRIFSDQELHTYSYIFDMQYPPPSMWLSKKHLLLMLMFGLLSNNHMQLFMIKIRTKHYNFHINMYFKN